MMQDFNSILATIDSYIGGSQWFVFLLVGTGVFFTVYLKFPQFRFFRHACRVVRGNYDNDDHPGDTSHFQALSTALSGTVGTGNIAGVALAIHLGGPSALFWMMMTAAVGMTTKLVEVTLSHKYRESTEDGTISGGPMYYMKNRLNMRWLAGLFAVATIFSAFGTGSLPQVNSISNSMYAAFGIDHYITGGVLAVLLALIVLGGIKRIAKVSERLVPFMAVIYITGVLGIVVYNYQNVIPAFISIFSDLFSGTAATGGFLGASVAWAFNRGVNRGLFSNEAGQGSAPIAHAAARTNEPVAEGMVALLEPFIDTIIICFLTGMALLSSGAWNEKFENRFQQADIVVLAGVYNEKNQEDLGRVSGFIKGVHPLPLYTGEVKVENGKISNGDITLLHSRSFAEDVMVYQDKELYTGILGITDGQMEVSAFTDAGLTITGKSLLHSAQLSTEAFKKGVFGDWGQYIIPFALLFFAFTTSVAWGYYGSRAVTYLWGSKYVKPFYLLYVLTYFFASFTDTTIVWTFSGITVAMMTLPNLIGILLLRKEVKSSIKEYWDKMGD